MYLPSQKEERTDEEMTQEFWAQVGTAAEIDEELQPYLKKKRPPSPGQPGYWEWLKYKYDHPDQKKTEKTLFIPFPEEVKRRLPEQDKWLTAGHISQSIPGELNDEEWEQEMNRVTEMMKWIEVHLPLRERIRKQIEANLRKSERY